MKELIVRLRNILDELNGITTGYISNVEDTLILKNDNKYYAVKFTEVEPIEVNNELRKEYYNWNSSKEVDEQIIISELLIKLREGKLNID